MADRTYEQFLGAAIRRRREGGALTQEELGRLIGIEQAKSAQMAISRVETGEVRARAARLSRIAEVLGTSVQALHEEAQEELLREAREMASVDAEASTHGAAAAIRRTLGGQRATENYRKRVLIDEEVRVRQQKTSQLLERAQDVADEFVEELLIPFVEATAQLGWEPQVDQTDSPGVAAEPNLSVIYSRNEQALRKEINEALRTLADRSTASRHDPSSLDEPLLVSVMTASAAASTAANISAFAEAITGTAVRPRTPGGTLTAARGMNSGSLMLSSVVVLPALIAAGGVLAYHLTRLRQEADGESQRVAAALAELTATEPAVRRTWAWLERWTAVAGDLTTVGLRELRWLERLVDAGSESDTDPMDDNARGRLEDFTTVIVQGTTLLSLPVVRDLDPDAVNDADREERAAWIDYALGQAEALVAGSRTR